MAWLSQNWTWLAVAAAIGFYAFRGRLGGRTGARGSGSGGMLGHMGHGNGESREGPGEARVGDGLRSAPEAAVDPVGGEAVRTASTLTSVYQETIYYFASKDNRDRFEAAPQDFAQKAVGYPAKSAAASKHGSHRGC